MEDYNTPKLHMDILKLLLKNTTELFDKNNIKYFIDGGTLLGAVRHKDIIPHDDDIDLGVLDTDWHKLHVLQDLTHITFIFNETEYQVALQKADDCLLKVFVPNLWVKSKANGRIVGTPTLDIFKWKRAGDIIKLSSPSQRKQFPNCYYKKIELFPLLKYKIGDVEAYGANNPTGYLSRYYGEDCLRVVKIDKRNDDMFSKNRNAICLK